MLNITITGDTALIARLNRMPDAIQRSLLRKVTALTFQLQALVKSKLTNRVLNVRTGMLRDSIFRRVESTSTGVIGRVASSGNVKYAAIHEFGGVIPAHIVRPKTASVLAFQIGGKTVFAKEVHIPAVRMPERSYMRSSLRDMRTQIQEGLTEAVRQGAKSA